MLWSPNTWKEKINFDLYSKNIYIGSSYNDRINYHDYSHECCYDIVFIGGITKNQGKSHRNIK